MHFLLQADDVSMIEKRTVKIAMMITDGNLISTASLKKIQQEPLLNHLRDAVPVGTVEFVQAFAASLGVVIPVQSAYPDCLRLTSNGDNFNLRYLHRRVWSIQLSSVVPEYFIRPRLEVKRFTGCIAYQLPDDLGLPHDYPIWMSEPVNFVAEWRYYILNGQIVGSGRYDEHENDLPAPELNDVLSAIKEIHHSKNPLAGYALDFGVLGNGNTALVELNDGWALGYYKGDCSALNYTQLLYARWQQILRDAGKL